MKIRMMKIKSVFCTTFSFLFALMILTAPQAIAQDASKEHQKKSKAYMRKAETAKKKGNFADAEAAYRMAIARDGENAEGSYNFGHLYTDNEMKTESMKQLLETAKNAKTKPLKHKS